MSDTPETDVAWNCFKGCIEPLQDVKELSRKLERERDAHEDALRKIYDLSIDGDEIWSDIEQISAIAHNALNHHE